jgi:ssDNA-binding Zn-finger/Zn-ribbon topoisomerase 1
LLAKHGGDVDADKMQTREELLDDAGLYGRHMSDDDVKEALLEDARKGNPEDVIEDQLAAVHKVHSNSTPGNIIKAALTALSNAVVASQVTPEEIVDLTVSLAKRRDFAHLIKLAELGSKNRVRIASRLDFHNKNLVLNPTAAIFNELGKVASAEVSAKDLHDVLATVSANYDSVTRTITASAQEIIKGKNVVPTVAATKASRTELLKAAMASHLNNEENVGRDHLKTALMAFAAASEDALVTPSEVIDSISELNADDLTARIEFAKNEKAISQRIATRARKEFYGASRFASISDLTENTIGWLADYSLEYEQSSKSISDAVMLATENPRVASNLVAKLIKTAKITITDERVVTKRISATCEELGIDPKSEDFEAQFRDKAISLLQSSGYTVDPNTFSLNDVVVSADGYVTASVTSRFTKTFDADSAEPMGQTVEPTDGAENPENLGPVGQPVEDEAIETDAAKQLRASKRKEILERIAQMAPAAPGMGAPVGALTMANEPDAGADAPADMDTDNMPEPGKKVPIGGICPACGSKNVDLADGKGHCNTCQTDMEIRYQITVMPNSDTENDKATEDESTSEGPLGGDMGLGAATAPAPEAPMGAAGGAPLAPAAPGMGAPAAPAAPAAGMTPMAKSSAPIMVRLSWTQNPDVFIKAAQPDFDPENEQILPVGHICPSCGDRHAKKVKNNRFCYNCGDVYIPRIHKSADKSKVEVSIDKIV